jgi:hypothetical protein
MARTAFVVNDALREKVRHLAGLSIPQDDIARIVGCAPKTLRKRLHQMRIWGVVVPAIRIARDKHLKSGIG